jgi:hypothetical protein
MTGLVQDYMFKEKLRNCEPIDVSRFVVDIRERHLDFLTPQSDGHPRERNSKIGVHYLQESLWQLILLTAFPITCSLTSLPRDVIRSVARI